MQPASVIDALIRVQEQGDDAALAQLHEEAFGPGRFARTAYRIREQTVSDRSLSLCAIVDGSIAGAVQFTSITIGGRPRALLLGPLVIREIYKNQGLGLALMLDGLKRAKDRGFEFVILVGDQPYYARAGFGPVPMGQIELPGPVDRSRLLYADLAPDAHTRFSGMVQGA